MELDTSFYIKMMLFFCKFLCPDTFSRISLRRIVLDLNDLGLQAGEVRYSYFAAKERD